jgi:hypothetical protein
VLAVHAVAENQLVLERVLQPVSSITALEARLKAKSGRRHEARRASSFNNRANSRRR